MVKINGKPIKKSAWKPVAIKGNAAILFNQKTGQWRMGMYTKGAKKGVQKAGKGFKTPKIKK